MIHREYRSGYIDLKDVTTMCIDKLETIPLCRKKLLDEIFKTYPIPFDTNNKANFNLSKSSTNNRFQDKTIIKPATHSLGVLKNRIFNERNKLDTKVEQLSNNYECKIFEYKTNQNQPELILVCYPNNIKVNSVPDSLPFIFYIPPAPQDDIESYRNKFKDKLIDLKDQDVPFLYKDKSDYPYSWDWIYFQFYFNINKFIYQLSGDTKTNFEIERFSLLDFSNETLFQSSNFPNVLVIPLIKDVTQINSFLNSIISFEKCLHSIQKLIFESFSKENAVIFYPQINNVSIMTFSNGHNILRTFITNNMQNWERQGTFWDSVREIISIDPDSNEAKNIRNRIFQDVNIKHFWKNRKIKLFTQCKSFFSDIDPKYLNYREKVVKNEKYFLVHTPASAWDDILIIEINGNIKTINDYTQRHNKFPYLFLRIALED